MAFPNDQTYGFKGMKLDRETLWCLWRRCDALKIGSALNRFTVRQWLSGMTMFELLRTHDLGRTGLRSRFDDLLTDLWVHDGCAAWV